MALSSFFPLQLIFSSFFLFAWLSIGAKSTLSPRVSVHMVPSMSSTTIQIQQTHPEQKKKKRTKAKLALQTNSLFLNRAHTPFEIPILPFYYACCTSSFATSLGVRIEEEKKKNMQEWRQVILLASFLSLGHPRTKMVRRKSGGTTFGLFRLFRDHPL